MKRCNKCKYLKNQEDFSNDRSRRDGLNSRCKICDCSLSKSKRMANPLYFAQKYREFIERNPEYRMMKWREWVTKNPEQYKALRVRFFEKHPDYMKNYYRGKL